MTLNLKVKDAMVTPTITGTPEQTIEEAAKKMRENNVGSLIIISDGIPVGIITREDIVNKVTAENKIPSKILVREIQTNSLVTCSPETDISEAALTMSKYRYERLPVVSEGKLIGIISTREVAKVAPAILEIATEHLRIEEPPQILLEKTGGECEVCGNYSDILQQIEDQWICDKCKDDMTEL